MKSVLEEIPTTVRPRLAVTPILAFGLGALLATVVLVFVVGERPMKQGVIFSAQWVDSNGNSEGRSRSRFAAAVPGGTGSWGVKMRGRLYKTHLEINYLDRDGPLSEVIPFDRLVSVQFGDGGLKDEEVVAQ